MSSVQEDVRPLAKILIVEDEVLIAVELEAIL